MRSIPEANLGILMILEASILKTRQTGPGLTRQSVRSNGGGDEDRGRERDRYNEEIETSSEVEFATLFTRNSHSEVSGFCVGHGTRALGLD